MAAMHDAARHRGDTAGVTRPRRRSPRSQAFRAHVLAAAPAFRPPSVPCRAVGSSRSGHCRVCSSWPAGPIDVVYDLGSGEARSSSRRATLRVLAVGVADQTARERPQQVLRAALPKFAYVHRVERDLFEVTQRGQVVTSICSPAHRAPAADTVRELKPAAYRLARLRSGGLDAGEDRGGAARQDTPRVPLDGPAALTPLTLRGAVTRILDTSRLTKEASCEPSPPPSR